MKKYKMKIIDNEIINIIKEDKARCIYKKGFCRQTCAFFCKSNNEECYCDTKEVGRKNI